MPNRSERRNKALKERLKQLGRQKSFANSMQRRYFLVEESLLKDARKIVEKLRKLQDEGLEPGKALEQEQERITKLLDSTREQIQRWADAEMQKLDEAGAKSAEQGVRQAAVQVDLLQGFGGQNVAALERIASRYETVPLTRRYGTAGLEAKERVRDVMFVAVAKGENSRTIVREIQSALGTTRDHADVIARSWMNDAHRGASMDYYRVQGPRIKGWEWLSAKNLRVCPVCLAMDGTIHPLSENFGSHPRCRCTHIPVLVDEYDEIKEQTGEQWYNSLSYTDKVEITGKTKTRLIEDKKINLSDLVHKYNDSDYGISRKEKSIRALIREEKITEADFISAFTRRNEKD